MVTYPILSSVLYLITDSPATDTAVGATIVLDETPDSTTIGKTCWQCIPHDNTFMVFPGNKLHGVLPSSSSSLTVSRTVHRQDDEKEDKDYDDDTDDDDDKLDNNNVQKLIHESWKKSITETTMTIPIQDGDKKEDPQQQQQQQQHRLAFMVGFWTRDVPATTMKHRILYGPCGPLPPTKTKNHTWVDEITQGYNSNTINAATTTNTNATCQQS